MRSESVLVRALSWLIDLRLKERRSFGAKLPKPPFQVFGFAPCVCPGKRHPISGPPYLPKWVLYAVRCGAARAANQCLIDFPLQLLYCNCTVTVTVPAQLMQADNDCRSLLSPPLIPVSFNQPPRQTTYTYRTLPYLSTWGITCQFIFLGIPVCVF